VQALRPSLGPTAARPEQVDVETFGVKAIAQLSHKLCNELETDKPGFQSECAIPEVVAFDIGEANMFSALLNRLCHWVPLDAADIAEICNLQGEVRTADRGQFLTSNIRPGSAIIVIDCWGARTKDAPSGRRIITEFLLPGELHVIDEFTSRTAATMALSKGRVLVIVPSAYQKLSANPKIRDALLWLNAVRHSTNSEWLVNIASRKAHQRLAHLLCELSVRLNGAGLLRDGVSEMPLTQTDLAAALAMSNVHLNIALQRLRIGGAVDLRDKHLVIRNREELDAIACFDDSYLLRWPTRLRDRRNLWSNGRGDKDRRRSQPDML